MLGQILHNSFDFFPCELFTPDLCAYGIEACGRRGYRNICIIAGFNAEATQCGLRKPNLVGGEVFDPIGDKDVRHNPTTIDLNVHLAKASQPVRSESAAIACENHDILAHRVQLDWSDLEFRSTFVARFGGNEGAHQIRAGFSMSSFNRQRGGSERPSAS
ncbi:hypothetical protein DF3PB_10090 [uncultured Defluviicoccus sp.]|uniref:Uncharacterized protein n=1 Tax=metagenome TaxID=256318 RepID=A0A380T9L2_9ZZZZ|nr:hypothetical protein DF3PB_10090 [uncultured Defluviicoccus sp.]